ncbi:MAG: FG-GAP-like repeat-containing protein [Candidatus Eisenbacteria bacterium]
MKFRRPFLLLSLLALTLPVSNASAAASPFRRAAPTAISAAAVQREDVAYLAVDRAALDEFRAGDGGALSLPAPDGGTLELVLERVNVLAPGATVTYTDATGAHAFTPDVTCYRGTVAGDPDGWAAIALTADGALGTVETRSGRLQLAPVDARLRTGAEPLVALAPAAEPASAASSFACGVSGDALQSLDVTGPLPRLPRAVAPYGANLDATRRTFAIAVDCDNEMYAKFASNLTNTTNYVISLMNVVSLIYQRDLEADLQVPYLNVWTTADPYSATNTTNALTEFRSYWSANRGGVSRALAHLVSARALGGGIAYVNTLCNNSFGYGVSAIDAAYTYPTNTSTWDATVVAHELGHNFGSYHTHSCNWQAMGYLTTNALIDSCQTSDDGTCLTPTPHVPADKGTIMSYCHLLTGGQSNIRLDFHPICVDLMRQRINAAGCGTTPSPLPPRNPALVATAAGGRLSWSTGGSTGVTGYSVYRSRTMLDNAPVFRGFTTSLQFDDTEMGTHYYKVRTVRAADSSGFSAEVKLNLCPLVGAPNLATGSLPIATLAADFDHDGIADLAVANNGASTVSVLRGQGGGTFAAGVAYTAAGTPACLAAADMDADGDLDLLVGTQADSALWVLPNAGDGTFGAGTRTPLAAQPSGLAVADFDEDGVLDVAVAGSLAGVQTLRGHAVSGVPDGAFEPPVTWALNSQSRGVIVGDFNEDSRWDLAVTAGSLKILRGNGTGSVGDGTFGTSTNHNGGATPSDLVSADFNLDGIADIAMANSGASSVSIFLGQGSGGVGNGSFPGNGTSLAMNSNPRGVSVCDWNGDGVPDLLVANSSTTAKIVSLATGKGDGTFYTPVTWAANTKAWAIALADFDGDSGADFAVANNGTNTMTVYRAGCTATATLALNAPVGGETWIATEQRAIAWTQSPSVVLVHVELSRDGGATWQRLASNVVGSSWTWTVTGAGSSTARVRVVDAARAQVVAQSAADFTIVPASALGVEDERAVAFGVRRVAPNPSHGTVTVWFALPTGGAGATLELLDLAGRRIAAHALNAFGPGTHTLTLAGAADGAALRPGVYLVRLARPGAASTRKVAIVR